MTNGAAVAPDPDRLREMLAELNLDQDLIELVVELSPTRGVTDLSVQTFVTAQ
jgi:hypothetical protein